MKNDRAVALSNIGLSAPLAITFHCKLGAVLEYAKFADANACNATQYNINFDHHLFMNACEKAAIASSERARRNHDAQNYLIYL